MLQTLLISGHLQYCRHFVWSWMHLYMFAQLIYGNPCIPWSGQNFDLNITWSVQNSLNILHGQDCPQPLINSTTEHYSNTCTHNTSLWLAFLANLQQGRAWNKALNCTNNTLSCLPEIYQKYRCLSIPDREWQSIWCLLRRSCQKFSPVCWLFIWSRLHFKDSCMCQTSTIICYCIFFFSVLDETSSSMYHLIDREVEMQQFDIHRYYFFNLSCVCRVKCNACEQWLYNT